MKVAIITPNTGYLHHNMANSLTGLMYHSRHRALEHISPSLTGVAAVRNLGASLALKDKGVTHTLWIDSDMTFPPDALEKLLSHKRDIVGCDYPKRDGSGDAVSGRGSVGVGLEEVHGLGFGFILIKRQVYEDVGYPYFFEAWDDKLGAVSEDVYFCHKVREAGYDIYCDGYLSHYIGHLGTAEYRL